VFYTHHPPLQIAATDTHREFPLSTPEYVLRFPFQLAPGQQIHTERLPFGAKVAGIQMTLSDDAGWYVLQVAGLQTREVADQLVPKIYAGLLWGALHESISPLASTELQAGAYRDDPEATARRLFPNGSVSRIDVMFDGSRPAAYETKLAARFSMAGTPSVVAGFDPAHTLERVGEALGFAHVERVVTDKRLRVSLDLYNAFTREWSQNARFLTLALALEALLPDEKKPAYAIEMVDRWIEEVKRRKAAAAANSEEQADLESMIGGLRFQKEVSISRKAQRLVYQVLNRRGDADAAELAKRAKELYGDRSTLVHEGSLPEQQLNRATKDLRMIMKRVLTARFVEVST
jgi:hypothetical protein